MVASENFRKYITDIQQNLRRGDATEHTHRPAFKSFLESAYDVDIRYLTRIEDHAFPTYISWLILTFALTLTGCPTISVPCGFTKSGLPVGIQIMAPWKEEGRLLGIAALFEQAAAISDLTPIDPRTPSEG